MAYSARGLAHADPSSKCFSSDTWTETCIASQPAADARRSFFKCYGHNWGDALRINSHSRTFIYTSSADGAGGSLQKKTYSTMPLNYPAYLAVTQMLISSVHLAGDVLFTPLLWRFSVSDQNFLFLLLVYYFEYVKVLNFNRSKFFTILYMFYNIVDEYIKSIIYHTEIVNNYFFVF
jgi:hypothetical protein